MASSSLAFASAVGGVSERPVSSGSFLIPCSYEDALKGGCSSVFYHVKQVPSGQDQTQAQTNEPCTADGTDCECKCALCAYLTTTYDFWNAFHEPSLLKKFPEEIAAHTNGANPLRKACNCYVWFNSGLLYPPA